MNRRDFLKQSALVAGASIFGGSVFGAGVSFSNKTMSFRVGKKRPNFLFILIDDMGWKDAGFMGGRYYETPNIDELACEGMVFTSAYANAPNCAPTRACFLTGQHSTRHGVITVGSSFRGASADRRLIPVENIATLGTEHVTIAEVLRSAGYVSASMGKWGLGDPPPLDTLGPCEQGFNVNIGGYATGHPNQYFSPYDNDWLPDGPVGEYLTDRLSDEAISFIETNKDRPFFLYLTHYAVHTPLEAKQDLEDYYNTPEKVADQTTLPKHDNATYAAMVHSVDEGIGRIMKRLKELKLDEDTVVVFFSDNGGHGDYTDMHPLRGAKGIFYEGGIREPMFVRWKNHVKPGTTCDVPVIGTDFFPTFLEQAGVKKPEGKILDGLSIVPLLKGESSLAREAIFWHFPAYLESYVADPEARDAKFRSRPVSVIRKGKWKLLQFFEEWLLDGDWGTIETNNAIELYDLEADIGEQDNRAHSSSPNYNPTKRNELLNDLIAWQEEIGAPNSLADMPENPEYTG